MHSFPFIVCLFVCLFVLLVCLFVCFNNIPAIFDIGDIVNCLNFLSYNREQWGSAVLTVIYLCNRFPPPLMLWVWLHMALVAEINGLAHAVKCGGLLRLMRICNGISFIELRCFITTCAVLTVIYLCNRFPPPLMLWVWLPLRVRSTQLCDKVCQWLIRLYKVHTDRLQVTEMMTLGCIKYTLTYCKSLTNDHSVRYTT
jgi:hypothetical protein